MKSVRAFLLLVCAVAPASLRAQQWSPPTAMKKLSNGLTVVVSEDHSAPTIGVCISYGIGFRLEPEGRTGFAHLFEHMMFEGTPDAPKGVFDRVVEGGGGFNNGDTRYDFTEYIESGPGSSLQTYREAGMLRTQADVRNAVTAPSFNEIIYELNRMATTSPTDEELTRAKRSLLGIQALVLQLRGAVARQLADNWMLGLPADHVSVEGRRIEKVSAADVDAAGQKYFPAMRMAVVAVGEEKVIKQAFAPFGIPVQVMP